MSRPFSVGINCAFGASQMRPYVAELARLASRVRHAAIPTPACPTPLASTTRRPAETARLLREFAEAGVLNIVGGCCGTTPEHIRAIATAVARSAAAPSSGRRSERFAEYSGLETLTIRPDTSFILIGERTNVTGSKRFARMVADGKYTDAAAVALEQVRGGANILDVNMDEGMLDSEAAMTTFLNVIATEPEIARLPFMVDSSKWSVIEAGLACVQGQGDRQLDQPQGRRRGVPAQSACRPIAMGRRWSSWHSMSAARRTRPGGRSKSASAPTVCSCARGSTRATSFST